MGEKIEDGQYLTQCLCILNKWTDEVAAAVIDNFNNDTYERIKKLFTDIRAAANVYFKNFFDENKQRWYEKGSKPDFYFGMWSEIILRTTDAPEELMTLYLENFAPLEGRFDNTTRANVIKNFFDKVGDTETLPSAYFQSRLGDVRFSQDRTKEALELATAAYNKVQKISLRDDERPIKISVMTTLADVFSRLNRYTDEIPLREKIVAECEAYFPDKRDNIIIAAKKNLAYTLGNGDRSKDALEIRRQIFELFDERDGEKFICVAKKFADALESNDDYESALPIRKKILALVENTHDDKVIVSELGHLIFTLNNFSDKEHLEERVDCYRRYFALCEKTEEEISYYHLETFAKTLKKLGLNDETEQILQKQADNSSRHIENLKRRIEDVDNPDLETVKLLTDLVSALKEADNYAEAERWQEKIGIVAQTIIKQTWREPIEDYDAAILTLNEPDNFTLYDGAAEIELKRTILALTEKKSGVEEAEIIEAKQDLANRLTQNEENHAEAEQMFEELENLCRKNLPTRLVELTNTLCDHAQFLEFNYKYSAAAKKFMEALDLLEKDSEPFVNERISIMKEIADKFYASENYSEELIWRERILKFCREHFAEDVLEISLALRMLSFVYERLEAH